MANVNDAGKLFGWKHQGRMSNIDQMNAYVPTISEKRFLLDFWKPSQNVIVAFRANEIVDVTSPTDPMIKHLLEWVEATKEKGVTMFLQQWDGYSPLHQPQIMTDTALRDSWVTFWGNMTAHFSGKENVVIGPLVEDVVYDEPWPYPTTGSASFNTFWRDLMTRIVKAIRTVDSRLPFCCAPTGDWSGGMWTLGSKAYYPNAFQPLDEDNIVYRVMWNPRNSIKTSSLYPFDDTASFPDHTGSSLLEGAVNFREETGLSITLETLVNWRAPDPWIWDATALQWLRDFVPALHAKRVGLGNFGCYAFSDTIPYCSHKLGKPITINPSTPEWSWVQVYKDAVEKITPTPPIYTLTVKSTPIEGVPFKIDETEGVTPSPVTLAEGIYLVLVPSEELRPEGKYNFKQWENGSNNPERVVKLSENTEIIASYELPPLPPSPPPEKGYLRVNAFWGEDEVEAEGRILEKDQTFTTPTTLELDPGTYRVECNFRFRVKIKNTVVPLHQTSRLDFNFRKPLMLSDKLPTVTKIYGFPLLSRLEELKREGVM